MQSQHSVHPVVEPWTRLKGFLAWGVVANAERPVEAPLADHLEARRAVAAAIAQAALAVVDACDRHPAERVPLGRKEQQDGDS